MGMFDYIKYKAPCRKCGFILTEWQSKDGECELATLEPSQVETFYGICPQCETWNRYKVIPLSIEIVNED